MFLLQLDDNQLQAVRAICSNTDSKELLLVLWILFLVCVSGLSCAYAHFIRARARPFNAGWVSRIATCKAWARVQRIAHKLYQTCAGLGSLVLYYYDLVSSIVVLAQIWGSWPSGILMAILFVHFAVTGAIVTFHAINKLLGTKYILVPSKPRTVVVIIFSLMICPMIIPIVLLLDAAVFARQVLLLCKGCCQLLHLPWLHTVSTRFIDWAFVDMPKMG